MFDSFITVETNSVSLLQIWKESPSEQKEARIIMWTEFGIGLSRTLTSQCDPGLKRTHNRLGMIKEDPECSWTCLMDETDRNGSEPFQNRPGPILLL